MSAAYEQLVVTSVHDWPTGSGQLSFITDGDISTQWGSNACRAGGWRKNKKQNRMYHACSTGICSASCSGNVSKATDGSPYTAGKAVLNHAEGIGWAQFPFPGGNEQIVESIYIRGLWPVNTTVFATVSPNSGASIVLGTLGPEQSARDIVYAAPSVPITGVRVQTATRDGVMRGYCYSGVGDCKTITVTEVAVQTSECYEEVTLDLGAAKVVSRLSLSFSGVYSGTMASSVDGLAFVDRLDLRTFAVINPSQTSRRLRREPNAVTRKLRDPTEVDMPNVTAQFLRFR